MTIAACLWPMPGRRSCPKDSPWGISGPVPQRGWRSTIPGSFMPRCRTHWSSDRPARRSASRSRIPAAPAPERSRSEAALPLPHAAAAALDSCRSGTRQRAPSQLRFDDADVALPTLWRSAARDVALLGLPPVQHELWHVPPLQARRCGPHWLLRQRPRTCRVDWRRDPAVLGACGARSCGRPTRAGRGRCAADAAVDGLAVAGRGLIGPASRAGSRRRPAGPRLS